jgi:molybdopterin molybdotransferase
MHWRPVSYTSIRTAQKKLLQSIKVKPSFESVPVQKSYGRVLNDNIVSNLNIPSKKTSHMDGFAVLYDDIRRANHSNPITLKVVGEVRLGKSSDELLHHGIAVQIPTGGNLPSRADTIIPIEFTKFDPLKKIVKILTSFPKGSFISNVGEDIKKNTTLLKKGNILRSQDLSLLLMMGFKKLRVFKKPRVTIIATGSELTNDSDQVKQGKILNTNGQIISMLVEAVGAKSLALGITPDSIKQIQRKIKFAIHQSDIIITIGGSSVGDHDIIGESINSLGMPGVIAHGVKLDRGRVSGVAALENKPIIILPGPIQGAVNGFIVFVQPIIRSLLGLPPVNITIMSAEFIEDWQARKKFKDFVKIVYVRLLLSKTGSLLALPITGETANITVLTRSNGYVLVPESITQINKGEIVRINLLPGLSFSSCNPVDFI